LFIFAGLMMLFQVAGWMPDYLWDVLVRLWPLALIVFGLAALIGKRTPMTNALILIGLFALVIVIFAAGYTRQALKLAEDNHQTLEQDLEDASDIIVRIDLSLTELVIDAQNETSGVLLGEFVGSTENELLVDYGRRGTQGIVTLTERSVNPIPKLDAFGSNRLTLHLPPDVPVSSLQIENNVGHIDLDFSALNVRDLDARTSLGDVTVALAEGALIGGDLFTAQGNVMLRFPDTLPVSLKITRGLGGSLQVPSGLDQLVGGRWRTQGIVDDEVRADLDLSSRFGDIIVEYSN
jgi:hypothetical protein